MQEGLEAASGPWGGLVGGGVASVGQPGGSQSLGPSSSTILLSVSRDRGSQPHHTSRQPADRRSRLRGKRGKLRSGRVDGGDGGGWERLAFVMAGACRPHPFLGSGEIHLECLHNYGEMLHN